MQALGSEYLRSCFFRYLMLKKTSCMQAQLLSTISFQIVSESNISFLFIVTTSRSCGCRPPASNDVEDCEGDTFHQCLFTRITISVGITTPNHIGLYVNYKICFDDATCKKGVISVFGISGTHKNSQISSEHFSIREETVRKHP